MKISAALLAVTLGIGSGIGSSQAFAQMAQYDLIPPYRVGMVVRSAGLVPVGPPTRFGATYIVRAIHRSGTPMRVVIDGRNGDILAARPLASLQPRGYAAPADPYGDPYDSPGYRAYAPTAPRPGAAIPDEPRYYGPDAPVGSIPPAVRTAPMTARTTPTPRARPASAPGAEVAAVKRPSEPSVADAPTGVEPAATEQAPAMPVQDQAKQAKPADQAFPPVQGLE